MKMVLGIIHKLARPLLLVLVMVLVVSEADAARKSRRRRKKSSAGKSDEARMEFKAIEILSRGLDFISQKQEERGIKLITSIPKMYPKSQTRFKAFSALGDFYLEKRKFDLAIKKFLAASKSENKVSDKSASGSACIRSSWEIGLAMALKIPLRVSFILTLLFSNILLS